MGVDHGLMVVHAIKQIKKEFGKNGLLGHTVEGAHEVKRGSRTRQC